MFDVLLKFLRVISYPENISWLGLGYNIYGCVVKLVVLGLKVEMFILTGSIIVMIQNVCSNSTVIKKYDTAILF